MPIATVNSKGQITLPISVRNALGLSAGAQVNFLPVDGSLFLVPVLSDVSSLKRRFAGRVKKPLSVDAINKAIVATC
jgi:antitoxin PrlF